MHDVRVRSLLWIATTWWLLAAGLPATAGDGDRLADIKAQIREEFPDVNQLSTQALERWLSTGTRASIGVNWGHSSMPKLLISPGIENQ